jgi:ABC-type polysaccharide/polyol phosphate transport system ATPase subunit
MIAIKIDHVSKLFHRQKQKTFKELIPALVGRKGVIETFWALQDINLEIKKGETWGLLVPTAVVKVPY